MSKWKAVRLRDVCVPVSTENPSRFDKIIDYIDISSIDSESKRILDYKTILSSDAPSRARQKVYDDDILVSTVRPNLNAIAMVSGDFPHDIIASTGFCVLRVQRDMVLSRFLFEFVRSRSFINSMTKQATGANYPAVSDKIILNENFPLPPMEIQQKIADVLDCAAVLIEKRKAQIEKLDLLVKSRFVEMFGDPVTNPMGWEVRLLGELGSLKNGMNYSQNDNSYTIHSLGVGDFGELYEIRGIDMYSQINLSVKPTTEYLLRNGDIMFVRSNGNRALVGRTVEVFPENAELTFSGFCIRYRNETPSLMTTYLNHVLHLPAMRKSLLKNGRGVNIQNVNQQMLSALKIPFPPLEYQNQFVNFVSQIDVVKCELKQSLTMFERNYNSLMQKCFRGEIF